MHPNPGILTAIAKRAFDGHVMQLEAPKIVNRVIARLAARRSTR
jgi:hypothetical protein